jgi:hypothetical protein
VGVLCVAREEVALTAKREIALNPQESAEAIVRVYGTPENESASFGHWEYQNGHASSWPTFVADFGKSPEHQNALLTSYWEAKGLKNTFSRYGTSSTFWNRLVWTRMIGGVGGRGLTVPACSMRMRAALLKTHFIRDDRQDQFRFPVRREGVGRLAPINRFTANEPADDSDFVFQPVLPIRVRFGPRRRDQPFKKVGQFTQDHGFDLMYREAG